MKKMKKSVKDISLWVNALIGGFRRVPWIDRYFWAIKLSLKSFQVTFSIHLFET